MVELNQKIGDKVICSQELRTFFTEHIKNFHFDVPFQKWLKSNPNKTYREAIEIYPIIKNNHKNTKFKQIDKQFVYNTYVRDFFLDDINKGRTLKDAAKCWCYKKNIQTPARYEREDLKCL